MEGKIEKRKLEEGYSANLKKTKKWSKQGQLSSTTEIDLETYNKCQAILVLWCWEIKNALGGTEEGRRHHGALLSPCDPSILVATCSTL
jgi:hypothetical protein